MPTVDTVEADALQLSVAERELLVERLILSLNADPAIGDASEIEPDDAPAPESHLRIVRERLADYRQGRSTTRSAFDIFDELTSERS